MSSKIEEKKKIHRKQLKNTGDTIEEFLNKRITQQTQQHKLRRQEAVWAKRAAVNKEEIQELEHLKQEYTTHDKYQQENTFAKLSTVITQLNVCF